MAFNLENVLTIDHLTAYDAKLKPYIDSNKTKAFKYVEVRDNAVCFFADPAPLADTEPSYKVDFPVELFLDQTRTKFEQTFAWNDVDYPGSTDPGLDGKPVLVLAVKGDDGSVVYSFLDMHTLVDVTVPAGGDAGDILTKKSGADYDMEWTKPAEGIVVDDDPTEGSDNAVSSGGVFTALAVKVDKVDGKQLSTEDYTTAEKEKLASLNNYDDAALLAALDLKVDKVGGMGLSSNDYTTEEKEKLAGLENYDDTALADRVTAIEDDYLTSADKTELTDAATAISDRVTAIENDYLTSADKTELQTETDTKIANRVGAIPEATTIKEYVDTAVGTGGTDAADAIATAKQEAIDISKTYTDEQVSLVNDALALKQDVITGTAGQIVGFDADGKPIAQDAAAGVVVDSEPTQDSTNAVSSGGVYTALQGKQDTLVGLEGQFVGFDADGNVLAQEVPAVKPVEMTQAEYDLLTDEQKNDGTVRYIVDGVTVGAVPDGGTSGQVLGKLSDDDGDYGWVDQTGGTGGTPDLVVTGEYSIGDDGAWSVSNVSETFATIDAALTAGQSVSLKVYPAGTTENPYILYPAMHYGNMGIMFALAVGDGGQVTALNVMLTPDGSAVVSQANYNFDEKQDKLVGGTTGQVLAKASDADGDTEWVDAAENPFIITMEFTDNGETIKPNISSLSSQYSEWYPIYQSGRPIILRLKNTASNNREEVNLLPLLDQRNTATNPDSRTFTFSAITAPKKAQNVISATTLYLWEAAVTSGSSWSILRRTLHEVPEGGTTGQVLAKKSDTKWDLEWKDAGGGVAIDDTATSETSVWSSSKVNAAKLNVNTNVAMTSLGFTEGDTVSVLDFLSALVTQYGRTGYCDMLWANTSSAEVTDGTTTVLINGGILFFSATKADFPNSSWSYAEAIYCPVEAVDNCMYKIVARISDTAGTANVARIYAYNGQTTADVDVTIDTLLDTTNFGLGSANHFYVVKNGVCYFQIYLLVRNPVGAMTIIREGFPKPLDGQIQYWAFSPYNGAADLTPLRFAVEANGQVKAAFGATNGQYMCHGSYPVG